MVLQRKAATRRPESKKTKPLTILERREIIGKIRNDVLGIYNNLEKYSSSPIKYLNNNKILSEFAEAKLLCKRIKENKRLPENEKQEHINGLKKYLIEYYKKSLDPIFKKFTTDEYNFVGSSSFKTEKMTVQEKFKEYQKRINKYITSL